MPVGIPQAWIEPNISTPLPPTPWTRELTGYYYIDNSVTCSDDNTYGHPGSPRCRFPTSLAAGSYVEIHGGPYNWTGTAYIRSYGTSSAPVWITGKDATISMSLVLHGAYLYVDGLTITGDKGISIRPYNSIQTDHIMIRNTSITGTGSLTTGTSGIAMMGATGLQNTGIIIYNNVVSYMGDSEATSENDRHSFQTGSYINDVWILDNMSHHNGGDGVQFSHGGVDAHHFYYGRNISHDERENCVDIKQANDVIISSNTCYGIEPSSSSPGEGMVVHYAPQRIFFIKNEIHDCITGIMSSGSHDLYIIGNTISAIIESSTESHDDISGYRTGAAISAYNTGNTYIAYNTIANSTIGISYEALSGYECDITGNIVSNLNRGQTTGNNPYSVMLKGDNTTVANSDIEMNLFYSPLQLHIDGTTYNSLTTLQNVATKCDDNGGSCLDTDPHFVSYPAKLSIKSTSPAIDKGELSPKVIEALKTKYNIEINIAEIARTQSNIWDIGAYEFSDNIILPTPIIIHTNPK